LTISSPRAGVTGRAYAFAYTRLTLRSLAQFVRDIAPEFVGKSVSPRARMRQMEKRLKLVGWQGFAGMVVGTLDIALWDALARAMDVPVAVLLGGELRPLPAYDSFGMLDHRTERSGLKGIANVQPRPSLSPSTQRNQRLKSKIAQYQFFSAF
jgi:L-alanine-DL-glutamate epimerase-like enolase superfamily enzyme